MKAFGYCRISVQNDEGVSLANQRERIEAWAKASGHELTGIFVEVRSAGRADNRPELKKAMAAVCREGGILVVYSLSRFSRSVRDTLALAEQLERCNANLASLSENLDSSTAMGRMFFKLMSVLAEFERDQLRERTSNAMSHLRQHNRRISSKIPLGYDLAKDGVTLLPNHAEQAAIARIVERRASGMTLGAIARSMVADGAATKQGGQWTPKTVLAILRRQEKLAA
ncbi:MAG: recombinase family protein [Opitutus sp.]|nr:recombinase family protein [Opitutus sp.]